MAAKRRFVGPAGAVFVPAGTIGQDEIDRRVAAGDWKPVEESTEKAPAKRAPRKKSDK